MQHKTATETDLRHEFEGFGTIKRVRIVQDKKGRSRGYAFIVYERERDMKGLSQLSSLPLHSNLSPLLTSCFAAAYKGRRLTYYR